MGAEEVHDFGVPDFHQPTNFPPRQRIGAPVRLAEMPDAFFDPAFIDDSVVQSKLDPLPTVTDLEHYRRVREPREQAAARRLSKLSHEIRQPRESGESEEPQTSTDEEAPETAVATPELRSSTPTPDQRKRAEEAWSKLMRFLPFAKGMGTRPDPEVVARAEATLTADSRRVKPTNKRRAYGDS